MEEKIIFESTIILNPKTFTTVMNTIVFTDTNFYIKEQPEIAIKYKDILSVQKKLLSYKVIIEYNEQDNKKQIILVGATDIVEDGTKSNLIYKFLLSATGKDRINSVSNDILAEANKLKSRKNIFSWKINEEELKNQIDNYNTLKINKSYRGISALFLLTSLGFTILISFLGYYPLEDVLFNLIIYFPILFFIYKGHRWAIILLMVLWTLDKGYQIIQLGNILPLLWWAIVFPFFYKALRVENERRKLINQASVNT